MDMKDAHFTVFTKAWPYKSLDELMRLIEDYDPRHVGTVLDLAHCGLVG